MGFEILGIALIVFLLLVLYMHVETRLLSGTFLIFTKGGRVKHRKMKSFLEPVLKNIPESRAMKFIHLTDIHVRRLYIPAAKIAGAIKVHRPDFMIFTGDYFQAEEEIEVFFKYIREIREVFDKEIYLCFGNHDRGDVFSQIPGSFDMVVEYLQSLNIVVLENEAAVHEKCDMHLNIIGLSDARSNEEDVEKIVAEKVREIFPNLLITHNCDILLKMKDGSVDFALAGHTHGAQIRSPFNIEIKLLHRRDKLSQKNIFRGYHRYKNIDLYINRGIGNTTLPLRFLSRPELLVGMIVFPPK